MNLGSILAILVLFRESNTNMYMTFQSHLIKQNQDQTQNVRFLTALAFSLYRKNATNIIMSILYN